MRGLTVEMQVLFNNQELAETIWGLVVTHRGGSLSRAAFAGRETFHAEISCFSSDLQLRIPNLKNWRSGLNTDRASRSLLSSTIRSALNALLSGARRAYRFGLESWGRGRMRRFMVLTAIAAMRSTHDRPARRTAIPS